MIKDLNIPDLMIAATYLDYRRRYDHFFSAFRTRIFFSVLGSFWTLILYEWGRFFIGLPRPEFIHEPYFIGVFITSWVLSGFIIHKFTLTFKELSTIDLYPEEYIRGNKLSFYFMIITLVVFSASLMWLDKQ